MTGGPGRDRLDGGYGDDSLNARDHHGGDVLNGGPGVDTCTGDAGDVRQSCVPPIGTLATRSVRWLSLSGLSRCFYAPSASGTWPLALRYSTHPVRSALNDPRGGVLAHFGVDIEAPDKASTYAIVGGAIVGDIRRGTWDEAFRIGRYAYYHVNLPSGRGDGSYVIQGGLLGHIHPGMRHVHVSEIAPGCGLVDPPRPTGVLRDHANVEAPAIRITVSIRGCERSARTVSHGAVLSEPDLAPHLYLTNLHGVVDFRSSVTDTPTHRTTYAPQQPMMVAGVRSYLSPVGHPFLRVGPAIVALRGSTIIPPSRYFHVMARGTRYDAACEYNRTRPCLIHLILHVAGGGFNTTTVPNGDYRYCVTAVTIANHAAIRCTNVTIFNAPRSFCASRPRRLLKH